MIYDVGFFFFCYLVPWRNSKPVFLWKSQVSLRVCAIRLNRDKLRGMCFYSKLLPEGSKVRCESESMVNLCLPWMFPPRLPVTFLLNDLAISFNNWPCRNHRSIFPFFYAETEHGREKTAYSQDVAVCKLTSFFLYIYLYYSKVQKFIQEFVFFFSLGLTWTSFLWIHKINSMIFIRFLPETLIYLLIFESFLVGKAFPSLFLEHMWKSTWINLLHDTPLRSFCNKLLSIYW